MTEKAEPAAIGGIVTLSGRENSERSFLYVLAESLLDNVIRMEETVGRVSDFIMSRTPDRETIVRLQDFDRLKQEFEALGNVLSRYANAPVLSCGTGKEHLQLQREMIAGITVADLKHRLLSCMNYGLPHVDALSISSAQAAEIGIDVVY